MVAMNASFSLIELIIFSNYRSILIKGNYEDNRGWYYSIKIQRKIDYYFIVIMK